MNIEELRTAFLNGIPVEYKLHCQKRMLERNISRDDIAKCVLQGEIIEDYSLDESNASDNSCPSCLILHVNLDNGDALHVVAGYNGTRLAATLSERQPCLERQTRVRQKIRD